MASLTNIRKKTNASSPLAGTMYMRNGVNTCSSRCVTPTDTVSSRLTIASIASTQRRALARDSFHKDITFTPEASLGRPHNSAKPHNGDVESHRSRVLKWNQPTQVRASERYGKSRAELVWESCDCIYEMNPVATGITTRRMMSWTCFSPHASTRLLLILDQRRLVLSMFSIRSWRWPVTELEEILHCILFS